MHNSTDPNQIPVTWETNASPDRHALLKAVALVFHRTIPLSTAADLTELDKTLSCERTDP